MVTETIEPVAAPVEEANLAPEQPAQTESAPEGDAAVAPAEEAVASEPLQVEVTPPKPESLSREEVEALIEERAERIRADEREAERGRRRTQAAREAAQAKREADTRAETIDVARATLSSALGVAPDMIPDDVIDRTISRAARKHAELLGTASLDNVEQAWDYLVAPVYGKSVDMDDSFESAARRLAPKLQDLVNRMRPTIEAEARKGYIAESELPKRIEQFNAAKAAKSREGQEELKHVEGSSSTLDTSIEARKQRLAFGGTNGIPPATDADRAWKREYTKNWR